MRQLMFVTNNALAIDIFQGRRLEIELTTRLVQMHQSQPPHRQVTRHWFSFPPELKIVRFSII